MKKPSGRGLRCFVFLMIGMISSGIVTIMYLTKSINLENFYDVGNIYDIIASDYRQNGNDWFYDPGSGLIVTQAENASCVYQVKHSQKNWNYLYLDIQRLSRSTPAILEVLGEDGQLLYTIDFQLQDGRNVLQFQEDDIWFFRITVCNPVSFAIKRMQFRERTQDFSWGQAPPVFLVVLGCYFLVMIPVLGLLRHRVGQKDSYEVNMWIETLQECYANPLERCSKLFHDFSEGEKSLLRQILFTAAILLIYNACIKGWNGNILIQRRLLLVLGICFWSIALLSWERANRAINWRNPLVGAWLVTWLMCIISELVIEKDYHYMGIFMLTVMGPFYMAWSSMKRPERLIRDILVAVRWFFWGTCVYCLVFRSFTPEIRYNGIYTNPNLYAGFLVTVNVIFLTWLDENLGREKLKKRVLLENIFGLVVIWGFLQLTGSLTSLAAYLLEWIVFLWKQFPTQKKKTYYINMRRALFCSLISVVLVLTLGRWALIHVPDMMGTNVAFLDDRQYAATQTPLLSLKVEAAEEADTTVKIGLSERIRNKITSGEWYTLFTGRTEVWIPYIRHWNLPGHSGYQECINGVKMHAHNAVLQMMHYYGIFIVIPYLLMLYYSVKYGITTIFSKNRVRMPLFFVLTSVNYVMQGLAEDIATPYLYVNWLMFYIALGGVFNRQVRKAEA